MEERAPVSSKWQGAEDRDKPLHNFRRASWVGRIDEYGFCEDDELPDEPELRNEVVQELGERSIRKRS